MIRVDVSIPDSVSNLAEKIGRVVFAATAIPGASVFVRREQDTTRPQWYDEEIAKLYRVIGAVDAHAVGVLGVKAVSEHPELVEAVERALSAAK